MNRVWVNKWSVFKFHLLQLEDSGFQLDAMNLISQCLCLYIFLSNLIRSSYIVQIEASNLTLKLASTLSAGTHYHGTQTALSASEKERPNVLWWNIWWQHQFLIYIEMGRTLSCLTWKSVSLHFLVNYAQGTWPQHLDFKNDAHYFYK